MIDVVDKVIDVVRDPSNEASKMTGMYKHPLPWIPDRENGQQGQFMSTIPEDALRGLEKYVFSGLCNPNIFITYCYVHICDLHTNNVPNPDYLKLFT